MRCCPSMPPASLHLRSRQGPTRNDRTSDGHRKRTQAPSKDRARTETASEDRVPVARGSRERVPQSFWRPGQETPEGGEADVLLRKNLAKREAERAPRTSDAAPSRGVSTLRTRAETQVPHSRIGDPVQLFTGSGRVCPFLRWHSSFLDDLACQVGPRSLVARDRI